MKSMRTFSQRALASAWLLALGLAGCGSSAVPVGDSGVDGGSCSGRPCTDGGPVVCGSTTCGADEVCCDDPCAGTSFCSPAGRSCGIIGIDCPPPPPTCADGTYCGSGEVCCDNPCDGSTFCSPSELGCGAIDCPPPPVCGGSVCEESSGCCMGCCGEAFCAGPDGACPPIDCSLVDCPPPSCGEVPGDPTCGPGQICCDNPCDGTTFCTPGGAGCPVFDCPPPPTCADPTACAPGEACCADCDGAQFCSAGGCPAMPCPPPPTSCGGFAGSSCALGEFCDYPAPGVACGAADGTGTCTARPEACTRVYDPVCGCDGRDYENECIAQLNGTDVSSSGTCASPASDCRTTGCAAGQSCIVCWSDYSCVPDGAVC